MSRLAIQRIVSHRLAFAYLAYKALLEHHRAVWTPPSHNRGCGGPLWSAQGHCLRVLPGGPPPRATEEPFDGRWVFLAAAASGG